MLKAVCNSARAETKRRIGGAYNPEKDNGDVDQGDGSGGDEKCLNLGYIFTVEPTDILED